MPFAALDHIICGDVLEALPLVPAESVHLAITSPPYNLDKDYQNHDDNLAYHEYLDWMGRVWQEAVRTLVPGGRICVNIGENKRQNITYPTYSAFIQQFVDMGLLYRGTIIWNKNSAAKHCAWGSWKSCANPHIVPRHEYVIVFSKGQWKLEGDPADIDIDSDLFMTCTRSVWEIGTESRTRIGHPAPFPEELPRRLIQFYSYRGNTVLDMFGGSGTVGLVAQKLSRHFILIDNSPKYCELALRRLREAGTLFSGAGPRLIPVAQIKEEGHASGIQHRADRQGRKPRGTDRRDHEDRRAKPVVP